MFKLVRSKATGQVVTKLAEPAPTKVLFLCVGGLGKMSCAFALQEQQEAERASLTQCSFGAAETWNRISYHESFRNACGVSLMSPLHAKAYSIKFSEFSGSDEGCPIHSPF